MTKLLRIADSRRLHLRELDQIRDYHALYQEFTTQVSVLSPPYSGARVDSFGFLYSMLREIFNLKERTEIFADIGEELVLVGSIKGGICSIAINCPHPEAVAKFELSVAEFLWSLVSTVADLTHSMREAGIDVDGYVAKLPPPLIDRTGKKLGLDPLR